MKVAAYQFPLSASASIDDAVDLIRARVRWCETNGVEILCCPEAVLGGLADYSRDPATIALAQEELASLLAPLASATVTTIVGFTEVADGRLYNSAAVFQAGTVVGKYRKQHPAIRCSVYTAGADSPVFHIGELSFGIIICNDSNFLEPANTMVVKGARAFFVPTNCGLPKDRANAGIVDAARKVDVARAKNFGVTVIRADVAGGFDQLYSLGCSGIVDGAGTVMQAAQASSEALLVGEIPTKRILAS